MQYIYISLQNMQEKDISLKQIPYTYIQECNELDDALDGLRGIYFGSALLAAGHAVHECAKEVCVCVCCVCCVCVCLCVVCCVLCVECCVCVCVCV